MKNLFGDFDIFLTFEAVVSSKWEAEGVTLERQDPYI